jgi:hypothetical protein
MVEFDKKEYWKRRKHVTVTRTKDGEISSATPAPLRGQTDVKLTPKIAKWTEEDFKKGKCTADKVNTERTSGIKYIMFGGMPIPANRAKRRLRSIDRKFTKKGYHYGIKIGSAWYNKMHHLAKIQAEKV